MVDTKRGEIFSSGTVTATGASDVLDLGGQFRSGWFHTVATAITGGETVDITLGFYLDSAGAVLLGTITFDQLTAGSPSDVELWPGDITARDHPLHMPRFVKVNYTLSGGASLSFIVYGDLLG